MGQKIHNHHINPIKCPRTSHLSTSATANIFLTLQVPETKIGEFANSVDLDEVAHLHCLPSSLKSQYDVA